MNSFVSNKRVTRKFCLHLKGQDPAQCMDTIDEMYDIYMEQQVGRTSRILSFTVQI